MIFIFGCTSPSSYTSKSYYSDSNKVSYQDLDEATFNRLLEKCSNKGYSYGKTIAICIEKEANGSPAPTLIGFNNNNSIKEYTISHKDLDKATFDVLLNGCMRKGYLGGKEIARCIEKEANNEYIAKTNTLIKQDNENNNSKEGEMGLFAQILREVIRSYPEAKIRAEREAEIRRRALIEGEKRARAACRNSKSC